MIKQLEHILFSGSALSAEITLVLGIVIIVLLISFGKQSKPYRTAAWALTLFITLLTFYFVSTNGPEAYDLFNNLLLTNKLSDFGKQMVLISAILILLHIRIMKYDLTGEHYIMLLSIILGLCILLMSSHFMSMFISLEMVSISSYMIVAMNKESVSAKNKSLEAGIKYLIFGAASTAIMLFGISLLFGATGTLHFYTPDFKGLLLANQSWVVLTAISLTLAGPLFKLSAAPFHIWAPDVYEATPTPIISFLAIAPKIGALFIIYRLIAFVPVDVTLLLSIVILLSILIGNFAAITQKDAKRMMGYSGIAQAGFMLIGLIAMQASGFQASIFYIATYIFISIGAFLMLDIVASQTKSYSFERMAGFSQRNVLFGIIGLIFMIALVGLPPTSGFTAKFLVFSSLWEQYTIGGQRILLWVLIFGLINTAISIYYYFKVPYQMFLKKPSSELEQASPPVTQVLYLGILALLVLGLFFAPQWVQDRFIDLF